MTSRARRSATKVVDYAKEQDFSDEDLFEDEEPLPVKAPTAPRRKPSRKSKENTQAVLVNDSLYQNSRPIYTEKGYDSSLPPPRERFTFMPEYEDDGTLKIELIVGRRPIDETGDRQEINDSDVESCEPETSINEGKNPLQTNQSLPTKQGITQNDEREKVGVQLSVIEYEYLVKYKGRSYLHLDWKTGADLESMNKSAKGIYSRYLKKLEQSFDEDIENPEFDSSYVIPEKIVDEAEQEITIELSDKELMRWEKQRERELAIEASEENDDAEEDTSNDKHNSASVAISVSSHFPKDSTTKFGGDWKEDEDVDYKSVPIDRLRAIVNKDESYYPVVQGTENPYRDGYITEPPKKPRGSYMLFQTSMRTFYQRKNPHAHTQSDLMKILGDAWTKMSDEEKDVFVQLSNEDATQYDKQKDLLDKAQKANGVWQPLRRCEKVLARISSDVFAEVFLEPVDTRDFPDYEDVIDQPMDLASVKMKLDTKKYQACEQFARDVRKVWNNCKIYNQHGSAIWYVADYMSKLFERIYHAWVLEFREKYIRWADPRARPWEHSCRIHGGSCGTQDEKMVLCDHCDAMYGMACLSPPLKKVPKLAWHCPDCKLRLKSAKGIRMLSAVAENAARKRAELGDLPKKTVNQMMYLVKWAGLGYEFCTWETKKDIGNDKLIGAFHRINKMDSDGADLSADVVESFLTDVKHINPENAGGQCSIPSLRAQLYAQSRAFHFLKFGTSTVLPSRVCKEVGSKSHSVVSAGLQNYLQSAALTDIRSKHGKQVIECLNDVIYKLCRSSSHRESVSHSLLPPTLTGEYDAIIPITSKGLMMNVGEMHGSVSFLGYRQFAGGVLCPAEERNLVKGVGDKIVAVDGIATVGMTFQNVIALLRQSGRHKFVYMRFQESKYSISDQTLCSVGPKGRYSSEELQKKMFSERQVLVLQKIEEDGVITKESDLVPDDNSEVDSEAGSEGSFLPESDDEDLGTITPEKLPETDIIMTNEETTDSRDLESIIQASPESLNRIESPSFRPISRNGKVECVENRASVSINPRLTLPTEATRSLAFRLLDIDVGYSSDEAGDDDFAYFIDGVDNSFQSKQNLSLSTIVGQKIVQAREDLHILPAKQSDFLSQGDRSKLVSSVALCENPPDVNDFNTFPLLEEKVYGTITSDLNPQGDLEHTSMTGKRSTVKVEQLSITSGDTVHIWANVEAAAATLQLPLQQLKQVIRGEYDEDVGDEVGGYKWCYALSGAKVTAGFPSKSGGGRKAKEAWLEFRDKLYDPSEPHIYKNGNRLRDYQVDGVNWLASTWYKKQGCILSDEMGLGKTVQIVCYIEHLHRVEKIIRPFLVVVPLSTIEHWRREFEGWTDVVCCVYHDRQRIWRDVMREFEWYYEDRPHTPEFLKFDVLVTTYDTLISDFDVINLIPFRVSVVDEAHRLRNQKGKLLECMREVSARGTLQYGFQSRVLMSGTPLQNDLTELWTLLNFIEPYKFSDLEGFQAKFGKMANRAEVEALQKLISPYMLRRVKEDVAKDIPAKEETLIDVELTSIQKQYYRAIFEHNLAFLNMGASRQNAPKLMNIQMELRKVCNHPFLLEGVEHRETDRLYKEFTENGGFEGKTPEEQQTILNHHGYVMTSGKMVLLDKLLPKLRQEGHKILVFSQMVKMLDLISEYCDFRGYRHERLDGRVRGTDRQKSIDRFENDKDSFLFLLSTRAGGVGINLTAADICIIFDSDWNPQNDVQAQARCHRIGQTKDVRVYRLITSRSFEQEMFERASRKLGLEQAILGTFEKDGDDNKPTQQEMEQLLKKGAYALLEDDNDEITREFCADDIESILAKRTRTRVVEGTKTASWLNKQGLVVSKSKFTSEAGVTLDMDDPLFWQKVMPDLITPSIMLQKLNELKDEIEGKSTRGPGRGRGKAKIGNVSDMDILLDHDGKTDKDPDGEQDKFPKKTDSSSEDEVGTPGKISKYTLSRKNVKGVHNFMSDLKSMMENLLEDNDDEGMKSEEKIVCQKLLLTISAKDRIFNDEQRRLARVFLKGLEGDRRRRCRTSEQQRYKPSTDPEEPVSKVRDELRIIGTKKKKKPKRNISDDENLELPKLVHDKKRQASETAQGRLGEDGYLHHSDSDNDWSHVAEDDYLGGVRKKDRISRKDSIRRRPWGADDDAATAAGRSWPVFPRHLVKEVLSTLLQDVTSYDESVGGAFSVPVPADDFPEYYEQIKLPMDYETMKKKLDHGEYRSAQAMQKDFVLILKNCRQFNSSTSDIVKEARAQHLMRPKFLREAAQKHSLFLAEDGTVLEIIDDERVLDSKKLEKTTTKIIVGAAAKKRTKRNNDIDQGKNAKKRIVSTENADLIQKSDKKKKVRQASVIDADESLFAKGKKKRKTVEKEAKEVVILPRSKNIKKKRLLEGDDVEKGRNPEKEGVLVRNDTGASHGRILKKKKSNKLSLPDSDEETERENDQSTVRPKFRIKLKSLTKAEGVESVKKVLNKEKIQIATKAKQFIGTDYESSTDSLSGQGGNVGIKKVHSSLSKTTRSRRASESLNSKGHYGATPDMPYQTDEFESQRGTTNAATKSDGGFAKKIRFGKGLDESRKSILHAEDIPTSKMSVEGEGASDKYNDTSFWKRRRESLQGVFSDARKNFTEFGPWHLPENLLDEDFNDVAEKTIERMCKHDKFSVFSDPVTETEAPGYHDVINQPMDFGSMKKKLKKGKYGKGHQGASLLYHDFLLVFDNCHRFNSDESDVTKEASRIFGLLPEAYVAACNSMAKITTK